MVSGSLRLLSLLLVLLSSCPAAVAKPTLWIIGDSTVRNSTAGQKGWGDSLGPHFDPAKIEVVNRAIGGRSSRSFLTEGRWDAILAKLQPGDHILMQFGHNDGGEMFTGTRPRASIKGNGEESKVGVVEATGKQETVHSYGWYLRKYATDAKARGAVPIILSQVPRNMWTNGKIARNDRDYALWAREAAAQVAALFIPFNALVADACEVIGPEKTAALFAGTDHTHTNATGAAFNAKVLAEAIRALPGCALSASLLPAELWVPAIFSEHMVIQNGLPLPVWGTARPGATITATLADQSSSATADELGHWRLELPALPSGGPHTLHLSSGTTTRHLDDLLVGEVWLCSGQSNMDFSLAPTGKRSFAGTTNWKEEVAAANHPRLRMFTAAWTLRESPAHDVEGTWKPCTPETAPDFSAVAYFFGRDLQNELQVPIGLITCAYGASTAEAWISQEPLAAHPQLKPLLDAFRNKRLAFRDNPRAKKYPDPVQDQHNPTVLYNGMIAPLATYPIRGAIWYQGESNVGTAKLYPALQETLIKDWRTRWNLGDFPFYFVQLASYKAPKDQPAESRIATMRQAQADSLALPQTGMAVTIDIGDEKDIHPRNKQDVGHRLAHLALAHTYGKPLVPSGPLFREQTIEHGRIRLHFDHSADGLLARDGPLQQFAIAGSDRKFVWAEATIDGHTILVRADSVPHPAYVRYAWADNPAGANLYNSAELPAAPFRTDP